MQRHTWRENGEEGLRFWKATVHGGRWTLESQLKGEEEWTRHEPIADEEWEMLREVLFRKYQRRRCPWKLIEAIDKKLGRESEGGCGWRRRGGWSRIGGRVGIRLRIRRCGRGRSGR
ncbi:MAG: hypothetical protein AAGC74_08355 [Verrucomicrobiota bacterium]